MAGMIFKMVLVAVAGYLLGSINTSLVVGRFHGVDVRKHGSGNAGATNTLRTLGKKAALMVTLGDILKGIVACIIGMFVIGDVENVGNLGVMLGGLTAILGHNWPVFFGFKGGKGVLTSLAVVMMMDWRIGLLLLGVFAVIVALTRYVSLGSILAAALFPVVSAIPVFGKTVVFIIFAAFLALLVVLRHRANIERIFSGTESKLGAKKTTKNA